MVLSIGSSPTEEPVVRRLNEIREKITDFFSERSLSPAEQRELLGVAEALFKRAPLDFLERTTVEELLEIAERCHRAYAKFFASPEQPFSILVDARDKVPDRTSNTTVICVLKDRPFIVDTLTETTKRFELSHSVLLHPIIRQDNNDLISLCYIETELASTSQELKSLEHALQSAFSDLLLVTDDFPKMRQDTDLVIARLLRNGEQSAETQEHIAFLQWLLDDGFVFFGTEGLQPNPLGLFRSQTTETKTGLKQIDEDRSLIAGSKGKSSFSKLSLQSTVHRTQRLESFSIALPAQDGEPATVWSCIGLLTSKATTQESFSVPIIRTKLREVLALEDVLPHSHDYKEILSIANNMAKSDLLQFSAATLRDKTRKVMAIQRRDSVRVNLALGPFDRFIYCSVILPRERFSANAGQQIQRMIELEAKAPADSSETHVLITDYPLAVVRYLVPFRGERKVLEKSSTLEREITELTLSWEDKLYRALVHEHGERKADTLYEYYSVAFPDTYKAVNSPQEGLFDIDMLERLDVANPLDIAIETVQNYDTEPLHRLRLYKRGASLTLSAILPFLENAGFDIVSETVTPVATKGSVWAAIYDLYGRPQGGGNVDLEKALTVLLPGLKLVLNGEADNDPLNKLLLRPGLTCTQIAILRTITHYLWQIKASPSEHTIVEALVENPTIAELLVQAFFVKFDPQAFAGDASDPARMTALNELRAQIEAALKTVQQLAHDRVLRRLFNVIEASVRTNFFRHPEEVRIALKIDCAKITSMPTPRPLFEIFVNAPEFEGVHLRGGKVARGGLRWSSRKDDYRTEVLGLMKTQMVKNSIIVPVGAKGGFILRVEPKEKPALDAKVKACYLGFVRSLLEVTDNRVAENIVPPQMTLCYDEPDPYLVVAADRGTATFSDVANRLAQEEFSFWLDDAFASGGSAGYDHKKLAITAKGTWEAVTRHFREIGIDADSQEFSLVGIGDMSGDVFGNGLLLSDNAKLIGAFDHRHIFVDPNPDSKRSFVERQRLFDLPSSSWMDYDKALLSSGGGIWPRTEKEIQLSEEAQQALGFPQSVCSGIELIRAILKAPVDLLWNGGIGTYVKAHSEDTIRVGDRVNDDVRIDARELRARVVGEGGNLGFTQLARIEYSRIGGHINVDAVDNSGGVDMSDLEVNLKLLLRAPVKRGELSIEERNEILRAHSSHACEKVVSRNRSQSLVLSLAVKRSRKNIGYYRGLISSLEQEGLLNRDAEFLPDDETLGKRRALKAGLTRPELAILIAYTKMSLYSNLLLSPIIDDPFLKRFLVSYFPAGIASRFANDVENHPLKREIIGTQVANMLVERMGSSFVYRTAEELGASRMEILRSFLAADAIIDSQNLSRSLRVLDQANGTRFYLGTLLRLQGALDSMTRWMLDDGEKNLSLEALVDKYKAPFTELAQSTENLVSEHERMRFQENLRELVMHGVDRELAKRIASLSYSTAYLDIIATAERTKTPVVETAKLYATLASTLHIGHLIELATDIEPADRWEALAIRTTSSDLRRGIAELAQSILIDQGSGSVEAIQNYCSERKEILERFKSSVQHFQKRALTLPALLVISNQLSALSRINS